MPRKYNNRNGDTAEKCDDLLNTILSSPNIQSSSSIQLIGMPLVVCVPSHYSPRCADNIAQVTPIHTINVMPPDFTDSLLPCVTTPSPMESTERRFKRSNDELITEQEKEKRSRRSERERLARQVEGEEAKRVRQARRREADRKRFASLSLDLGLEKKQKRREADAQRRQKRSAEEKANFNARRRELHRLRKSKQIQRVSPIDEEIPQQAEQSCLASNTAYAIPDLRVCALPPLPPQTTSRMADATFWQMS